MELVLGHLQGLNDRAKSFRARSVMDYWVGDQRVKGTVLVMGRVGARVRFNALNPTGGNTAADLACDGVGFEYIDYNNNCQLTGLCNRDTIAQLLRVSLDPDDFLLLAVGATPLIENAAGTITWDPKAGHEILELVSVDNQFTQTIHLDGVDRRWDVIKSVLRDARGNELWRLENKEFSAMKTEDGLDVRVPGKTRFQQPPAKADLIVRWEERTLNLEIEIDKFNMEIPEGLPRC